MTDNPRDLDLEPINLRAHEPKIVTTSHAILQLKKSQLPLAAIHS
jgi:hypothetical protein